MPHAIDFVDDTSVLAHYALLEAIKDFCDDAGWTIHRYDTGPADRELIMEAPGYVGPDGPVPAFIGIRTYQSVASDYYNLAVAGMTGYVSGNSFDTQPGIRIAGVPAHNQRIDYWMTVNDRRLAFALKVGTPVYESAYLGYLLPYATPLQFPYPLVCGGMLNGTPATRFSDTNHGMPYKGNRTAFSLRFVSGSWIQPHAWPWGNDFIMNPTAATNFAMRPTGTYYPLLPVVLHDNATNVYGELEGIFAITGFDNAVENTLEIGGEDYVVIQDVYRTGFVDYYAIKLDPNP